MKPFDMQELLLKVHNLLQRLQQNYVTSQEEAQKIRFNEWIYQPEQLILLHKNEVELKVTYAEHELLMMFLKRPNRVISREEMMALLADDDMYDRAIDSRISRLKKKINLGNDTKSLIQSVYGCGYVFNAQVDVEPVEGLI